MKRPRHSTVIAYVALFFAMGGTAAAATGGTFILGRSNHAATTTTLTNTHSVPLSVQGSTGRAPLIVNSKVKVKNLDADLLDGVDSAALQRRLSVACPAGQAITAIHGTSITCVAVSVGSSGPSTPSQGQSKGWVISDVQISQDTSGDFQAVARLTNDNASTQTGSFTLTAFNGTTIVSHMISSLSSVPAGQTFTADFSSFDPFGTFTTWTFQTDSTFNG